MTILTPAAPPRGFRRWRRPRVATLSVPEIELRERRAFTGWLGLLFAATAVFSSFIVPLAAADTPGELARLVAAERGSIVVSQAFGAAAALLFAAFAIGLSRSVLAGGQVAVLAWTGWGITAAAMASAVTAAVMGFVGSPTRVGITSDLYSVYRATEILLYIGIMAFAASLAIADNDLPTGIRTLSALVGFLALGRFMSAWAETSTTLSVVAAPAFVALIGVIATWMIVAAHRRPAPDRPRGRRVRS